MATSNAETPKKKAAPKKKGRLIRRVIRLIWVSFLLVLVLVPLYVYSVRIDFMGLYGKLPSLRSLENPQNENDLSSELYFADGVLMGRYFRENRSQVSFDELSPNLVNALVATEDIRFYDHSGIDLKATLRAVKGVLTMNPDGGGSTLSQQLAKNLFRTRTDLHDGSLTSVPGLGLGIIKTKEWIVSVILERSYTKEEILSMYLNTVDFGSNAFGIKVAAQTFFNKTPTDLNVEEAAVLVGLLKAPTRYSPVNSPEVALNRRNTVMQQMVKYNFLTQQGYDSLRQLPITLDYKVESHNQGPATYFRSEAKKELMRWCKANNYDLFEDGLRIYTTIDSRMQAYAEQAVQEHMSVLTKIFEEHWEGKNPWIDEDGNEVEDFIENKIKTSAYYKFLVKEYGEQKDSIEAKLNKPKKMRVFAWDYAQQRTSYIDTVMSSYDSVAYYNRFLHAGFMAVNPYTGQIQAWVGGVDHRYFKYDHVNQGKRQPGSTFKPFVYTKAIEDGYNPCYKVKDEPVTFFLADGESYTPQNTSLVFTGQEMTLRQAMARSVNSITAYMIQKVGIGNVVDLAKRMGIESRLDAVPSLALGVSNVNVFEMVGAYSTFVNSGTYTRPYFIERIEDKRGNILERFTPVKREALSEETAYTMLYMLRGGTEETGGTAMSIARELRNENEIGGKTGTTQNYSDGWFMGVTKDIVAGTWVGGNDIRTHFSTIEYGQGARMALPIYNLFMQKVFADEALLKAKDMGKGPFTKPNGYGIELDCSKYSITNTPADSTQNSADSTILNFGLDDLDGK